MRLYVFGLFGVVTGLIDGLPARLIVPGRDPRGLIVTIVPGTSGALVATLRGRAGPSARIVTTRAPV